MLGEAAGPAGLKPPRNGLKKSDLARVGRVGQAITTSGKPLISLIFQVLPPFARPTSERPTFPSLRTPSGAAT